MRIIVSGPPCSGKSTLAARLAAEHDAELIDFDAIAKELGSTSHHDHPWSVRQAVRTEIERRLDALTGSAVVIRSAPEAAERRHLADRIEADRVIVLAVDAEEAKRRAERDERPAWTHQAIDRWWSRYQPDPADETITTATDLDSQRESTTPRNPEETHMTTETAPAPSTEHGDGKSAGTATKEATQAGTIPDRLPDDHPLVTAFAAVKAELAETKSKLKTFEDANKSEIERAAEQAAAEKERADRAEAEAARLAAAVKYSLTQEDLELLDGVPADKVDERAKKLAERLSEAKPKSGNYVPKEGASPGPAGLNSSQLEEDLKRALGIG